MVDEGWMMRIDECNKARMICPFNTVVFFNSESLCQKHHLEMNCLLWDTAIVKSGISREIHTNNFRFLGFCMIWNKSENTKDNFKNTIRDTWLKRLKESGFLTFLKTNFYLLNNAFFRTECSQWVKSQSIDNLKTSHIYKSNENFYYTKLIVG